MNSPREHAAKLTRTVIGDHARERMELRQITEDQIRLVLGAPEEIQAVRPSRVVAQRVIRLENTGAREEYLFRVFVDIDRDPPELVTAYRTSRIAKYRRQP